MSSRLEIERYCLAPGVPTFAVSSKCNNLSVLDPIFLPRVRNPQRFRLCRAKKCTKYRTNTVSYRGEKLERPRLNSKRSQGNPQRNFTTKRCPTHPTLVVDRTATTFPCTALVVDLLYILITGSALSREKASVQG